MTISVVDIAAEGLPGGTTRPPEPRPLSDHAWGALLDEVRRERLDGLLLRAIMAGTIAVTAAQHEEACRVADAAAGLAVRLERRAADAVAVLTAANIDSRVLKGTAVAHLDYPEPSDRHHGDVDLLVPSAAFGAAVAALRSAGWHRAHGPMARGWHRRFGKALVLRDAAGLEIDLHRTLADGAPGVWVVEADLWVPGQTVELDGRRAIALPREQRFAHACLHACLGAWPSRAMALRDVAQMASDPDLDLVIVRALAQRWRASLSITTALADAWTYLRPMAVPPPLDVGGSVRRSERMALAAERHPDRGHRRRTVSTLGALRGPRAKAGFVRAMVQSDATGAAPRRAARATVAWASARNTTSAPFSGDADSA
jgi:Uncharacterised nucleotidyltransferase